MPRTPAIDAKLTIRPSPHALSYKITVNNILPIADTWGASASNVPPPTNALRRYGSPEEDVAPVALFLATRDGQYLTGYSLTPDGGSIIDAAR
jgi:NAD(P)-dependent dehydrogenase (short-subunit alcohol dehydrogenase family)